MERKKSMRGIDTPVRKIRREIFREVANVAYNSENINNDIEAIPYKLISGDEAQHRESIYRERAVVSERVRLAMGMSLRPEDKPVHITDGIQESNIDSKYYEPPLMQVIPSACESCDENKYEVSNMCKGCVAHPCMVVCPKGAISFVNGNNPIYYITLINRNINSVSSYHYAIFYYITFHIMRS